jgi:hypothetical protein
VTWQWLAGRLGNWMAHMKWAMTIWESGGDSLVVFALPK